MWLGGYDDDVVKSYFNESFKFNKSANDLITWMGLNS